MKWLNVQIVEKRLLRIPLRPATCVELPSAKNAGPPDYVPRVPNSGNQK